MTAEQRTNSSVMLLHDSAPTAITLLGGSLGSSCDVREEHGRQYAVELSFVGSHGADEPLDLIEHLILIRCGVTMVRSRDLPRVKQARGFAVVRR
jgi:hypothetical protein